MKQILSRRFTFLALFVGILFAPYLGLLAPYLSKAPWPILKSQVGVASMHIKEVAWTGHGTTPAPPVRFAAIGDYGVDNGSELDVANLVKSWNPDFIITLGDNNYPDGATTTIDPNIGQYYHEFIGNYTGSYGPGSSVNRFFPALGNHDWHATGATPYLDYFSLPSNERYYDFVQGPVHLFVIDSDTAEPDGADLTSTQATWLRQSLAASTARWKLVYFHHPPYSSGMHGSTKRMQWPFQEWGATAVLTGHDHLYERLLINQFPYFVNGAGGAGLYSFQTPVEGSQVRYNIEHGAMRIDATDASIEFRFIATTGEVIDTYIITAEPLDYIFYLPLIQAK